MKIRLLLNFLGAAVFLVIVTVLPNLAQSQTLLHPTPIPLVNANDTEIQGEPETSYGDENTINEQPPLLIHHSAALNSSVVTTIPVGLSPAGIGVNAVTNHIYVANRNSNTVSVIDGATQQVIATVPVGTRPSLQIGVNATTNRIYVPNNGGNSLAVIDGATHTVITTITGLATSPEGVAVHPGRNLIYVTHSGNQLSVIDGATHSISMTLDTGYWNHFVAVNANTDLAYVSISDPHTVAVIDLVTQQKTTDILGGGHPAINPLTNRVYLTRYAEPVIGVVDGTTQEVITLINIEDIPGFATVNPTNNRIYVTLPNRDKVVIIDGMTNAVVGTIAVGEHPLEIAVNPDTGLVYVGNVNSNTVSVIQDDKDGDGLFDVWETQGLTVTVGNAAVFVDLPAMGANPDKKDIFVEVDYMVAPGLCLPLVGCHFGHSHQPKPEAIARVVQAFADAPVTNPDGSQGITLHVDYGPDSIMNPVTGERWGIHSQGNGLPHANKLGTTNDNNYAWDEFDALKADHFSPARAMVFHYCIFAHTAAYYDGLPTSGISRGISASDFIVSLGDWPIGGGNGTVKQQAGTFMHELGHNFGLRHGGGDHTNYKPNFLSVMNYSFQLQGLTINRQEGHFDYSRFALPDLNENDLDESAGLNGGPVIDNYGTRYHCWAGEQRIVEANGPINWNCNLDNTETGVQTDINKDENRTILSSYNDWENLVFTGGAIGQPGAAPGLPMFTMSNELTQEESAQLASDYQVAVIGLSHIAIQPGNTIIHSVTVANLGVNTDTYTITLNSSLGWADISHIPNTLTLAAGISTTMPITVSVPLTAVSGMADRVTLATISQGNPLVEDTTAIVTSVIHQLFLPMVTKNSQFQ